MPEDIKAFERASAVDRVMVEKTLGLGEGTYSVHHIRNIDCGKEEMLTFAAHLSCFSNLAEDRAIVDAFMQMARYEGLPASSALRKSLVTGFEAIEDKGLSGHIGGRFICTGTVDMMKLLNIGDVETEDGYKLVHVAYNQKYMGYIALSYEADQEAETVYNAWQMRELQSMPFSEKIRKVYMKNFPKAKKARTLYLPLKGILPR